MVPRIAVRLHSAVSSRYPMYTAYCALGALECTHMHIVTCTLPSNAVLQLVWLAYSTGRTVDVQAGIMVYPGDHSLHCLASARLYGCPVVRDVPAAGGFRRVSFELAELQVRILDETTGAGGTP